MPQTRPEGASRLNSRSVRDHNLALVLHALARSGGCSRSYLHTATGLTPGAVTLLVNELLEAGLVEATDVMRAEGGRRKRQLALGAHATPVAVLELRVDGARLACETFAGCTLAEERYAEDFHGRTPEEFARFAGEAIAALVERLAGEDVAPLAGMGVVVPGSVYSDNATVLPVAALGWGLVDLGGLIASELRARGVDVPVVLLDGAACAGWAEYRALADGARDGGSVPRGVLYITADQSIGGACIVHGRIYRGTTGTSMAIGHLQFDPDGELCACGKRGCLMTYADPEVVIRKCGLTDYMREHGRTAAIAEVQRRRAAGDERACRVAGEAIRYMRVAIENALTLLTADCVILGGFLSGYRDELLAVENGFTSLGLDEVTSLRAGQLGFDAALRGGLMRMRGAFADHAGALMRGEPLEAATLLCDMV